MINRYLNIIIIVLTPVKLICQTFYITLGSDPVIDKFSKEIYFYGYYYDSTGKPYWPVQKTDIQGQNINTVNIPNIPSFSNNSRKAIVIFNENDYDERFADWEGGYYYVDFDNEDSIRLLIPIEEVKNFSFWRSLSQVLFSPDDSKFLLSPYYSFVYYSFEDSSIHNPDINNYTDLLPQWTSDTTLLCNFGDERIFEYNYVTNNFDTIINKEFPPYDLDDYSYNKDLNLMIYSTVNYSNDLEIELNLFDMKTKTERNVFHYFDERFPTHGAPFLEHLEWSPNNDKVAIISNAAIEPHDSRILIYYFEKDSLYLYEDLGENDYYNRHALRWYDNNIIIFENVGGGIYGLDTSIPIHIEENFYHTINDYLLKQNYPNPFNTFTTVEFRLPYNSYVNLSLYNIEGRLVDILLNDEVEAGTHKINWDGSNYSSGFYFYKLTSKSYSCSKRCLLLK